jgi:hypothetical protein
MPLTLKAALLVMGFWMYLTVTLAVVGFFLVSAALAGHALTAGRTGPPRGLPHPQRDDISAG